MLIGVCNDECALGSSFCVSGGCVVSVFCLFFISWFWLESALFAWVLCGFLWFWFVGFLFCIIAFFGAFFWGWGAFWGLGFYFGLLHVILKARKSVGVYGVF